MSHVEPEHNRPPEGDRVTYSQPRSVEIVLLHRIRKNLHRWAARYASSDHAKAHARETRLLIQEIDALLLKE
jgi:hypothetical protein